MESRSYALITGLFVIGLVAALIAWANWLAQEPRERKAYRVVATTPPLARAVCGLMKR